MAKTPYLRDKDEEIVNALLHATGFGLSLAGTASLAYSCIDKSMLHWVAAMSFMLTLNFTYAMSAVYHGTLEPGKKRRRRMYDHLSIYTAIGGGWSPVFLLCMSDPSGSYAYIAMWTAVLLGSLYKIYNLGKHELVSLIGYLVMGWAGFYPIATGLAVLPDGAGMWLLAGGFFYTFGSYFYFRDYKPYFHSVWHIMVMLGSICHFISLKAYIIG